MFSKDKEQYIEETREVVKTIEDFNESQGKISPSLYNFLKSNLNIVKRNLREIKVLDCEKIDFYEEHRTKIRKVMSDVNKALKIAEKILKERDSKNGKRK